MMANSFSQIELYLKRINTLVPHGSNVKDYLKSTLEEHIASVSPDTPMGVVPISMLSATKIYASASIAVELIDIPSQLAERSESLVDLGIIEWLLRPALLLKKGLLESPVSGPWQQLKPDVVKASAKSVCRIDLCRDGYTPIHLGTGFVIGTNMHGQFVVMTNAHVIDGAKQHGWSSQHEIKLACDFARDTFEVSDQFLSLSNEYDIHLQYDIALVYISSEQLELTGMSLVPLLIAENPPDSIPELEIGVIGHPSFDSNRDPFPKYFGFGDEFGVKRFSPGFIRNIEKRNWRSHDVEVFLHDATTLSGSSGSCILDLKSMNVVGLHFGGWPMQRQKIEIGDKDLVAQLFLANGAAPLWGIRNDPLFQHVTLANV